MNYRTLGRTGFKISEIGLGTWQLGGKWGSDYNESSAEEILATAVDHGVNFIDTADVYSAGKSEFSVGQFLKNRSEKLYVATKCGRQISPHINENYQPKLLRQFVEASLSNMQLERIDLIQLHCPPAEVYYRPEIFELFDRLIEEGKIHKLGVSVEKIEEAIKAIEYDNVDTVQIIFNIFRQRPAELFFEQARKKNIGVIARVPLASGLLSGKFGAETAFGKEDHRHFNRNGEMFDKGETFSGLDYTTGLNAVEKIKKDFPTIPAVQLALKWILMHEEVSTVIPGASTPKQIAENIKASAMQDLTIQEMQSLKSLYKNEISQHVHHLW